MMPSVGSGENRAGMFSLCEPLPKTLPRLRRTSSPLALAASFVNAFVDFDFEPLLLIMTQHQLIGQPVKDCNRPI
jgi:hypothetical protein